MITPSLNRVRERVSSRLFDLLSVVSQQEMGSFPCEFLCLLFLSGNGLVWEVRIKKIDESTLSPFLRVMDSDGRYKPIYFLFAGFESLQPSEDALRAIDADVTEFCGKMMARFPSALKKAGKTIVEDFAERMHELANC